MSLVVGNREYGFILSLESRVSDSGMDDDENLRFANLGSGKSKIFHN